ncbi:MAG: hypothetical protein AB2A00_18030 [Myxococcota bacterium]
MARNTTAAWLVTGMLCGAITPDVAGAEAEEVTRKSGQDPRTFAEDAAARYERLLERVREFRRTMVRRHEEELQVQPEEVDELEGRLKDLGGLVRWLQETEDTSWTGVHDEVALRLWELESQANVIEARLRR